MPLKEYRGDDDDEDGPKQLKKGQYRFNEFDCPGCNANNPTEAFGDRQIVLCNYCGMEWEVRVDDDGKLDFKER